MGSVFKNFFLGFCLLALIPSLASGDASTDASIKNQNPEVLSETTRSQEYYDEEEQLDKGIRNIKPEPPPSICPHGKSFCLFPLNFPYLALKSITYPFAYLGYLIEKYPTPRRLFGMMGGGGPAKDDFSIYPKVWRGDGGNFGFGLGVTHRDLFEKQYMILFDYLIFTNLGMRSQFIFGNPNAFYAFNRAFSFYIRANFWREFEQNYYGLGNNSSKDNQSLFSRNRVRAGFVTGFEIIPNTVFALQTFFDFADSGPGDGNKPSVQQTFSPQELPGFDQNIQYFVPGLRFNHDTRDNFIYSNSGGRQRFMVERYQGVNRNGFDFWQFSFEVEHFITVGRPRYVLWLHTQWALQQTEGGNKVPFYRLLELDYNRWLRAFRGGRFRDQGSYVFNVEQRFPLWNRIDGHIFVDAGRVFHGLQNISFKDIKYSGGLGLTFHLSRYYSAVVDTAYGNDGFQTTLKLRQVFFGLEK